MATSSENLGISKTPDKFQPSLHLFPIQNNRAAYKPFALPVVLVVPYSKDSDGNEIANSIPTEIVYSVEDGPPQQAIVAGVENRGVLIPDHERFRIQVSSGELLDTRIPLEALDFYRQVSSTEFEQIDFEDAVEGDFLEYTLENETKGRVIYYPNAFYYDLSRFFITTAELPDARYNFVWSAKFSRRLTLDGEFVCIGSDQGIAAISFEVACPGEVHSSMVGNTPAIYFEGSIGTGSDIVEFGDQDVVKAYRPFSDTLQDIWDEQSLLQKINWVDKIPVQLVPYLAFMIGIDLPNFPGVSDNVRLSMLKNGVDLQRLKGTKRALRELFEIFGFSVDLINTWYLSNGSGFVAPGENLNEEHENDEISVSDICQYDLLLNDYSTEGFGELNIPLLYRPKSNTVTLNAYLVKEGSESHQKLLELADNMSSDLNAANEAICSIDSEGFFIPNSISSILPIEQVEGFAQVLVDRQNGAIKDFTTGSSTISKYTISFDGESSVLNLDFDGYQDFESADGANLKLFVFAQYNREEIILPTHMKNNRSNRFDIDIMFKSGEIITSNLFDFLINFVIKFKAFHSLIRKIRFNTELCEIYNVTDFCVGWDYKQRPGTDAGELQVPPAVIPIEPDSCDDSVDRGFKDSDLAFRKKVLNALEEEFENWKSINKEVPEDQRALFESLSRLAIPASDSACGEVEHGQDRVISKDLDLDHEIDDRETLCDLNNNTKDYCYKGRVKDLLADEKIIKLVEYVKCNPCHLTYGDGRYYTLPGGTRFDKFDLMLASTLHKLIKDWKKNDAIVQLYFSNRNYLGDLLESYLTPAMTRPSLNIMLPFSHFPGHRFAIQSHITDDFTHTMWRAKPWDDAYSDPTPDCKGISDLDRNLLNAQIIEETDGIEILVFDDAPLIYIGNGLPVDISSYGSHEARSYQVTHKIFTTAGIGILGTVVGNPVVELDSVVHIDAGSIVRNKLFDSWNSECSTDYIDGYPAEADEYNFVPDEVGYDPENRGIDAEAVLKLPTTDSDDITGTGGTSSEALFKWGSGIICADLTSSPISSGDSDGSGSGSDDEDVGAPAVTLSDLATYELDMAKEGVLVYTTVDGSTEATDGDDARSFIPQKKLAGDSRWTCDSSEVKYRNNETDNILDSPVLHIGPGSNAQYGGAAEGTGYLTDSKYWFVLHGRTTVGTAFSGYRSHFAWRGNANPSTAGLQTQKIEGDGSMIHTDAAESLWFSTGNNTGTNRQWYKSACLMGSDDDNDSAAHQARMLAWVNERLAA